jgi:hypothetical protein
MFRFPCITLIAFLLPVFVPAGTMAAPAEQLLDEAVGQYRAALDCTDRDERLAAFRRAELLFAQLVGGDKEGRSDAIRNADLYVNLGNAALGAERLGPAMLAYRRALALDPDHHRASQNLDHARTLLPDWVPRPEKGGLLDTFFFWSRRLSVIELQTYAAFAFLIAAGLLACSIRWRQPMLRNLAVLPGFVWILLLGVMLLRSSGDDGAAAVVIIPEVTARSADSPGAPPRLPQPLPSGTEVQIVETREEWSRVRLFDGRDVWLPASAVDWVSRL